MQAMLMWITVMNENKYNQCNECNTLLSPYNQPTNLPIYQPTMSTHNQRQDEAKNYMQMHNVPPTMQRRVQRWYDYAWSR